MAVTDSVVLQEQVQAPPARPPEPPPRAPRRRRLPWIAGALVLVVIAAAVATAVSRRVRRLAPVIPGAATLYAPVARGKLVRTLRVGGVLAARQFAGISAPSLRGGGPGGSQLTLVRAAAAGALVKQGELLAEFERQTQQNTFEDRQAEVISLTDQIAKRRAELEVERAQRQTELVKGRADLDAARLENRRNEVISRIDAEKNQQALAEAEASLNMFKQTAQMREDVAAAELKLLEIRRDRERLQMENARLNFERLFIRAPISGLVVRPPIWKGNSMGVVQEGDQVRPGVAFLQVVDSSKMLVRAQVNQLDAALLRPGLRGVVRLDAYPDLRFSAQLETLGTLGQAPGWWTRYVKTFSALFSVEGQDPRLLPDISASVDVELEEATDAVLAPRGAVVRQAGSDGTGFVWVKQGDQVQRREIKLGLKNDTHWAVTEGLKEGEMVALFPPAEAPESHVTTAVRRERPGAPPDTNPNAKTNAR